LCPRPAPGHLGQRGLRQHIGFHAAQHQHRLRDRGPQRPHVHRRLLEPIAEGIANLRVGLEFPLAISALVYSRLHHVMLLLVAERAEAGIDRLHRLE